MSNSFHIDLIKAEEINQISELLKFIWQESFSDFLSPLPASILFSPEKIKEWVDAPNSYTLVAKAQSSKIIGIINAFQQQDRVHIRHFVHTP
ncbi:MAG: hypothetical protein HC908_03870 [Calothrix sp. SM1_7_51]|nr:hypothetical protein [Calothrix sp. SM1_7_51]